MTEPKHVAPSYGHVAWMYDALAWAYSCGAIDRAKAYHHSWMKPGDRVLYAGAGRGQEIVEACRRGARVTCVEPCPAMAGKLHERLSRVADDFAIVPKPIQSLAAAPMYDTVVAHFFLNVFDTTEMSAVLDHLCAFVKPGGRLILADFRPARADDPLMLRALSWAYYRPLNLAGRVLKICAPHPIYDYALRCEQNGFAIERRQTFTLLLGRLPMYEVIVAHRR